MKEDARFNIQSLTLADGALDRITMVTKDHKGNLWIGTQENGVSRYDGHYITTFRVDEGLNNNNVISILADAEGNIWLLSNSEVVTKFDGKSFTHYYLEGIKNESGGLRYYLEEDKKGNIWIALIGAGVLVQYNPGDINSKESFTLSPVKAEDYFEIFEDSKENLWMGTTNGAFRFDGQNFLKIGQMEGLSDEWIYSFEEDKHGNIWISGIEGLFKFEYGSNGQRDKISGPYHFEGIQFQIGYLTEINQMGHLWCMFNGGGGMGRFNMDKNGEIVSLSFFGEEEGLRDNRVRFFTQRDWAGNIWMGTAGGSLNFYGKNQFQFFGKKEGLISDVVSAIEEDSNGFLWLSQFQYGNPPFLGVNRYDPDAFDGQGSFTHITQKEGLIKNAIIDILPMENGDVWFGTGQGGGNIGILSSNNSNREETFINFYPARYGGFLNEAIWSLEKDLKGRIWTNNFRRFEPNPSGIPEKFIKYDYEFRSFLDVEADFKGGIWFALALVNQMLDLRQLESGSMKLNMVQGDVIPYLKYLQESFHSFAEAKNIRVHFISNIPSCRMDYDPEKLQQIVTNLMSNAIKFTPGGGDVYMIIDQTGGAPGSGKGHPNTGSDYSKLILKVRDTGIDISPENLENVFDRFYQVDATATREGEGTGIGLSLTKALVELMGGSISVSSELGKGSEFQVILPISRQAEEAAVDPSTLEKLETAGVTVSTLIKKEERVVMDGNLPLALIVEDNADVVQYLQACLDKEYQVEVARDGQEGIEKALELIPDIIISDVMMPKKNGFELCETLKQDERSSHIPIVLLTAKADPVSKKEGLQYGADAYLTKPFDKEELFIRLRKLIELRNALRAHFQVEEKGIRLPQGNQYPIEKSFLKKLTLALERRIDDPQFGPNELAEVMQISRSQLHRKLKAITGQSTSIFMRSIRLRKATELLKDPKNNISEVVYECGFSSPAYFNQVFKEEFGKTPSEWRKG